MRDEVLRRARAAARERDARRGNSARADYATHLAAIARCFDQIFPLEDAGAPGGEASGPCFDIDVDLGSFEVRPGAGLFVRLSLREREPAAEAGRPAMRCPRCGRGAIVARGSYAVEPHGETHWDEWSQCDACGERYDEGELAAELAWLESIELACTDLDDVARAASGGAG